VIYLLGCSYACLRVPFWRVTSHRPANVERILVMFGSSDIRGLTTPALKTITAKFPGISVDAVMGLHVVEREVAEAFADHPVTFYSLLDAVAIRRLMLECDIAIVGGGQTLYELAACGAPAVAIELVDNQRDDLQRFAAAGLIDLAGHWQDYDLWGKVAGAVERLRAAPEELARRACLGQALIDGHGARRLAKQLADAAGLHQTSSFSPNVLSDQ